MRNVRPAAVGLVAIAILAAGCGSSSESVEATTGAVTTPAVEGGTPTSPATETPTTPSAQEPGQAETETTAEPTPGPQVVRIRVVGARPQGGIARPKVDKGETVVLVVSSDVADELHLHGYDLSQPVAAGGTARLKVDATIPGRFELELEERGVQIAELTVR